MAVCERVGRSLTWPPDPKSPFSSVGYPLVGTPGFKSIRTRTGTHA